MSKVWKWIIGVVIAVVILAVIVGGVWLVANRLEAVRYSRVIPQTQTTPVPNNGRGPYYYGGPMMPYGRNYPGMPMMRGHGFGMFFPFGAIIGLLCFLGFAALVVLGIVWLVRYFSRRPGMMPPAPVARAAPAASAAAAADTHACANCGQPVPNGFAYCPNCGTKQ